MFSSKTFIILAVMAALTCSRLPGGEAPKAEDPVMKRLLFRPDQLPKGCAILKLKPGDVLPFGKGNPVLSADRKFVGEFSAMMFGKESPVRTDGIAEGLFSVYRSTNEIGVFAWRFRTEDAARIAEMAIQKRFTKDATKSVYRTKDVLAFVWHDDSDDPAAPQMRALVKSVLADYGKQKPTAQRSDDPVGTDATAEAATTIRSMIPATAGMREGDMATVDKLAAAETTPNVDTFKSKPLSVMLMAYKIQPPGLYKAQAEEFCFEVPVSAEALLEEIRRSRNSGYYSMIQPDRITDFTCEVDGNMAKGVVSFKVPHLYEGKVHYVAERAEDQWEIKEFHLPAHGWKFVRAESGRWKWFCILGEFSDMDSWRRQSVTGNITLDGKPLAEGTIEFFHTVERDSPGIGVISNGTYRAKLPVGSYHVVIHNSEPEVPEKYRTPDRSGLMIEVKEGENRLGFDLVTE